VEAVNIIKGTKKPVCIEITLANSAGIFQVDELLSNKLNVQLCTFRGSDCQDYGGSGAPVV